MEIKKENKKEIKEPSKFHKYLSVIFYWIIPFLQFFALDFMKGNFQVTFVHIFLNAMIYYGIYTVLFLLSKRKMIPILITSSLWCIIAVINTVVIQFRGTPVTIWDIASTSTALSVVDNYTFTVTLQFLASITIFLITIIYAIKIRKKKTSASFKKRLLKGGIALLCTAGIIFTCSLSSVRNAISDYDKMFSPTYSSIKQGFLFNALGDLKNASPPKPENYDKEEIKKLLSSDALGMDGVKPNVIVIMNEAFSTLETLGDFTTSEPLTPYIDSLKNSKKGTCITSVIGGNTAVSEFEFLTGLTDYYIPRGIVAYNRYIRRPMPTVVSNLEELGYSTNAMHPYFQEGWNRSKIYNFFGFDTKTFIEEMLTEEKYKKIYDTHIARNDFLSDEGLYKMIIEQYENRDKSKPYFNFSITIQNHGGYEDMYKDATGKQVTINGYENDKGINTYLSLIKESDRAFETLVSYFENVEEPTVILMFGDHQLNNLYATNLMKFLNTDITSTEQNAMKRYATPYVAWSNYGVDFSSMPNTTSLNYLAPTFLDAVGIPLNSTFQYVNSLREEYPIIYTQSIIDKNGNIVPRDNNIKELNIYEQIQYYNFKNSN